MWVKKTIVASAAVLTMVTLAQGVLAQPPRIKTFSEAKIMFVVNFDPLFVDYADPKEGRCLIPSGSEIWILNKVKNDILAEVRVPASPDVSSFTRPCNNKAMIRVSESRLVEAYNTMADYDGGDRIAMDVEPSTSASDQETGD